MACKDCSSFTAAVDHDNTAIYATKFRYTKAEYAELLYISRNGIRTSQLVLL